MKIIHTADLHLNSSLTTRFTTKGAKDLNDKVFLALENLLQTAQNLNVKVIIIAGDLFDSENVSPYAEQKFKQLVQENKQIKFIFVYGNHDYSPTQSPFNFGDNFIVLPQGQNIKIDNVTFTALPKDYDLNLDPNLYNVVVAHGDTTKDISIAKIKDKNVDYLALGHIHKNSISKLDYKGVYAYSGCLSGRGFDECGTKGFYLIDTDSKTYTFKEIDCLNFYIVEFNIKDTNNLNFYTKLKEVLSPYNYNSAIKVALYGENTALNIDTSYLNQKFKEQYFYIDFIDKTSLKVNTNNAIIKEFIAVVKNQNYTQEEQNQIINLGIKTLK